MTAIKQALAQEPDAFSQIRTLVRDEFGFDFDAQNIVRLTDALAERSRQTRCRNLNEYLSLLNNVGAGRKELAELAKELTIAETYFFRHAEQLEVFRKAVLPEVLESRGGLARVLCAGCASGEEPYSLAILAEQVAANPDQVLITGVDLDERLIQRAKEAKYSQWALRETPDRIRNAYFTRSGQVWSLVPRIRSRVSFRQLNLLDENRAFWRDSTYDIIFCRNVLIYFSAQARKLVIEKFHKALSPQGYLFLGHAETLRGITTEFSLEQHENAFFYRRRTSSARARKPATQPWAQPLARAELSQTVSLAENTAWVDAVKESSSKISSLIGNAVDGTVARKPSTYDQAFALFRQERFTEALAAFDSAYEPSPETQLLHAILLVTLGRSSEAQAVCRKLLEYDDLNAQPHYVLALSLEHLGKDLEALEHDRAAIYLDPSFAMPFFHMGIILKRHGDLRAALNYFRQAEALFKDEDPSRLLLFGGGFVREQLLEIARLEQKSCGGAA